ncbi:MAG: outer membrane protein assembly factor BamA, partial [Muribaculaceae bacterium]|nr:outer membrane protein assembly factor BamA [Muribaculaceae bacterium]
MRSKILLLLTLATLLLPAFTIKAQVANDTIYNPTVLYSSMPRTYEIAGITVEGAPNYDEFLILGYAGLKVGDRVTIPGDDITAAAKRLMRQTLFSQARIELVKTYGDKAWLNIVLRTQPRIASVNFIGAKKGEIKDLNERLQLVKGNQITQNIVNRAEAIVKKYYTDKGYSNADVHITLHEDLSHQNEMIVDINVDKHNKVKVHKIYLQGNEVLSDGAIKRAMKKTNEKSNLLKLFSQKKFIESDYEDDLNRILEKYNEKGYRDARIITDSVVAYDDKTVDVYIDIDEGKQYYIKDIQWVGNTIYPTEVLDDYLGMKTGDVYNQKQLQKRLMEDEDAVSNLYMDNGYLFYNLVPIEREVVGDSIVLEMRMMEGPQARINNVIINGNDRLYEKVIRRELRIRPGDLFSKSDLIRSMREIAQTGHFNPENMAPDVSPNEENGTVDIALNLESKANDQIEFSLGWGQTGIIGKLQLKFTNFSIKNLFYPSTYRGVIPQGEGQTFSIAAQTNARYYQSYSISFLDPWFGGRRPNSLSVSAYYARQTGVNSSYYNNTWANSSMLGYGYGLYGYGYGGYGNNYSDYFQSSYENSLDPNKVLQMVGV